MTLYKIEFRTDCILYLESENDQTIEIDFQDIINPKYHDTILSITEIANEL